VTGELISVLLVDEHELFRRGVEQVLASADGIAVVGEAADGQTAVELAEELRPDIVVLDLRMPICDGIDATRLIRRSQPGIRVIVLSDSDSEDDIFGVLRAGASGFLLKNAPVDDVVAAIRSIAAGGAVFSPSIGAKLLVRLNEQPRRPSAAERLTVREREVLRLLTRGLGNRAIAAELFIAENTVKNHVRAILDKLDVRSRTEAAMLAAREGLT
jgi:DNA-binding NarL/FixJ family response regulator